MSLRLLLCRKHFFICVFLFFLSLPLVEASSRPLTTKWSPPKMVAWCFCVELSCHYGGSVTSKRLMWHCSSHKARNSGIHAAIDCFIYCQCFAGLKERALEVLSTVLRHMFAAQCCLQLHSSPRQARLLSSVMHFFPWSHSQDMKAKALLLLMLRRHCGKDFFFFFLLMLTRTQCSDSSCLETHRLPK